MILTQTVCIRLIVALTAHVSISCFCLNIGTVSYTISYSVNVQKGGKIKKNYSKPLKFLLQRPPFDLVHDTEKWCDNDLIPLSGNTTSGLEHSGCFQPLSIDFEQTNNVQVDLYL